MTLIYTFKHEKGAIIATDLLVRKSLDIIDAHRKMPDVSACEKLMPTGSGGMIALNGAVSAEQIGILLKANNMQIPVVPTRSIFGIRQKPGCAAVGVVFVDVAESQLYFGQSSDRLHRLMPNTVSVLGGSIEMERRLETATQRHLDRYGFKSLHGFSSALEQCFLEDQSQNPDHMGFASYLIAGGRVKTLSINSQGFTGKVGALADLVRG